MTSLRFKIWRFLIKCMFLKKDKHSDFDPGKMRKFDTPAPPGRIRRRLDIEKQSFRNRDVFYIGAKQPKKDKVLLYFHGGAFVAGISALHWNFMERLSALAYPIVLPAYPLAPEHDYRETTSFAVELYKHLLRDYDANQIYLIGDSAGGNLCLSLSLILNKNGLKLPHKLILLSPWLDLTMGNPVLKELAGLDVMLSLNKLKQAARCYAGNSGLRDPEVSPLFGDLSCLPETHYFIGTHDVLYADARMLMDSAAKGDASIRFYEFDRMMHVWMLFPLPEAREVIREIKRIVDGTKDPDVPVSR